MTQPLKTQPQRQSTDQGQQNTNLFGVYVHWPFCASKCPYCDFNSHVRDAVDTDAFLQAYLDEIRFVAQMVPERTVTSVFFGGGTPSLMPPKVTAAIIDAIAEHWTVADHAEITLEANPTSVEAEKFKAFRDAGINRVSVGVQSLNDDVLAFLGRQHSAAEAVNAIKTAQSVFGRYSFDLMYARPDQSLAAWKDELSTGLSMGADHMSLYQLTIEKGTSFFTRYQRGDFTMPHSDLAADFYGLTQDMMSDAGLPAYEVSNHARAGQESFHNLTYWRYGDYAGIGAGAHGRLSLENGLKKIGTRAHAGPEIWLERVQKSSHGFHPFENISDEDRFIEALMMGLRLKEGVSFKRLKQEAAGAVDVRGRLSEDKLSALSSEGLITYDTDCIIPTTDGLQRLNTMLDYLLNR